MKGCFGMAIAFNTQNELCVNCHSNKECATKVSESLIEIHQQTDVTDFLQSLQRSGIDVAITESPNTLPRQHKGRVKAKKGKVPTVKLDLIEDMPKKSQALASAMLKIDPDFFSSIKRSINPFVGVKPSYLAPAIDVVIKKIFTKSELSDALLSTNKTWKPNTIRSHCNLIIGALSGLQVIEKRGKNFVLKELQ